MPAKGQTKPFEQADMIHKSSDLSSTAMKLLQEKRITVDQYKLMINTANMFVDLYINWDKPAAK